VGKDLSGKRVLITGAGIGIGREIALGFAAAGCRLALTFYEDRAETEDAARHCLELGAPEALVFPLQLADDESIRGLAEGVLDRFGELDILVNNAGVSVAAPFLEQEFGQIEAQLGVDLIGTMKLVWVLLPCVTDAVICIGSTAALHGTAGFAPYCAGKWGMRGFVKALALEHPQRRICCVHPPRTATRMNDFRGLPPADVARVVLQVARGDVELEPGADVEVESFVRAPAERKTG
jgi:NAD(P)-dependent dehydrogenase (short-subunit alcohol dehydrogenase family)